MLHLVDNVQSGFAFGQHVQIAQRHQICAALYECVPTNILARELIVEEKNASVPTEAQVYVSDVPKNSRNI